MTAVATWERDVVTAALAHTSELDDEDLMRRVQTDDVHAFDELYARYHGQALGSARHICKTAERAEEAVQDAFLCLWTTRARYDQTRGDTQTWLFALIRNRSIDTYRRNRRHDAMHASDSALLSLPADDSLEDGAIQHDEVVQLRASLQHLPHPQREAIVLAYFGGLTQTEIAGRLALPIGTVKGRIRLGLTRARAEIDRENSMRRPRPPAAA